MTAWRVKPSSAAAHAVPGAARTVGGGHSTIDWFFEPLPATGHPADAWVVENQTLVDVPLEVGITDGTWTQVLSGDVRAGEELVSSVLAPAAGRHR
jgi:hypothetical protein